MIERFAGDAIIVVFNAAGDQPDHARAATARGARAPARPRTGSPRATDWPRFRVGINTGRAVVGNVGTRRAAELHGDRRHDEPRRAPADARPAGQVVIGGDDAVLAGDAARVESLGRSR